MVSAIDLEWNPDKSKALRVERGFGFEEVAMAIESGKLLGDVEHHQLDRQDRQRILIVEIDGYICAVPYVRDGTKLFLKTAFRSRALHAKYKVKS